MGRLLNFCGWMLLLFPSFLIAQHAHPDYLDGKLFIRERAPLPFARWQDLAQRYEVTSHRYPFRTEGVQNVSVIEFGKYEKVGELIRELETWDEVEYAEMVPLYTVAELPNDLAPAQYAPQLLGAPAAWDMLRNGTPVQIAIVDDAFNLQHEDLVNQVYRNTGELPGDGIDNDGNGFVDDVFGYDVADQDPDVTRGNVPSGLDHGTQVAGIASAATNNGKGMASVGYGVQFIPVKAKKNSTYQNSSLDAVAEGIDYAVNSGARIVNLSFAGNGSSITLQNIISAAHFQGITIVAAAGNDGQDRSRYPAAYDYVVSVGATDANDVIANFSNWNATVDVMAPGVSIYTSSGISNTGYLTSSGTSLAAPLVSGTCALLLGINPQLGYGEVSTYLIAGCVDIDSLNPGYEGGLGAGRINVYRSAMLVPRSNAPVADFDVMRDTVCLGDPVEVVDRSAEFPQEWEWDWGDGSVRSTGISASHVYTAKGDFSIQLKVRNNRGEDSIVKQQVVHVRESAPLEMKVEFIDANSLQLNASGCTSYQWSPPADLSCVNCPAPIYAPANFPNSWSFTCECVDAFGCQAIDSVGPANNSTALQLLESGIGTPYPNPAIDRISLPLTAPLHLNIQLYDAQGRALRSVFTGKAAPPQLEIELPEELAVGIYLLRIRSGEGSLSRRIQISR